MSTGHRWIRRTDARLWLLLAALAMLGTTALRPSLPLERSVYRHLVVFDITQSMNVADATPGDPSPSRLEFAKASVVEALRRLPCGSSVGLGIFTGHRTFVLSTPVQVCEHYGELATMIEAIDWRMAWIARSEVAKGVHSALLATDSVGNDTTLVFLTDGHEAPPIHPDFRPRFEGRPGAIKGALGGIGGTTPVPIPKLKPDGTAMGNWEAGEVLQVDTYTLGRLGSVAAESMVGVEPGAVAERIANGTEHLSSLRESYLEQLAGELGLEYRRVASASDMSDLLQSRELATTRVANTDLRWLAALVALAMLVAAHVLPSGRRARRRMERS